MIVYPNGALSPNNEPDWEYHQDFWFGVFIGDRFIPIRYTLSDWEIQFEFDVQVVRTLAFLFQEQNNIDLRKHTRAMRRLFTGWTRLRGRDWRDWTEQRILILDILPDIDFDVRILNGGRLVFDEIRRRVPDSTVDLTRNERRSGDRYLRW